MSFSAEDEMKTTARAIECWDPRCPERAGCEPRPENPSAALHRMEQVGLEYWYHDATPSPLISLNLAEPSIARDSSRTRSPHKKGGLVTLEVAVNNKPGVASPGPVMLVGTIHDRAGRGHILKQDGSHMTTESTPIDTHFTRSGSSPPPFSVIPQKVLYSLVSDRAVRLYGILDVAYRNDRPDPSRAALSSRLRCSRTAVISAIEELVSGGYLTVEQDGNVGDDNHYILHGDSGAE